MRTHRQSRLVACAIATMLTSTLVACTGSGPESGQAPTDGEGTSTSPTPTDEEAAGGTSEAVEDPAAASGAPEGPISRAYTVPFGKPGNGPEQTTPLSDGLIVTDDLIVFLDKFDFLNAVDRETGQQVWRIKRRSTNGKQPDSPCALIHPDEDSEVVVVNHGLPLLCGAFTVYSLADGSITDEYASTGTGDAAGDFHSNSPIVTMDEEPYFLDDNETLQRITADGTLEAFGNPAALVKDTQWTLRHFSVLPGSDVFMVHGEQSNGSGINEDERAILIGFRINDTDLPEIVWTQSVSTLMSKENSPGHVVGRVDFEPRLPGIIADQFRKGGKLINRYRAIDPQTGELSGSGFVFNRDPANAPTFALAYNPDIPVVTADHTLFTEMATRGSMQTTSVRGIDLTTGKTNWDWPIPTKVEGLVSSVRLVKVSPDESLLYVATSDGFSAHLWELDAATGEVQRKWAFRDKAPMAFDLRSAAVTMDNGDLLRYDFSGAERVALAVYR